MIELCVRVNATTPIKRGKKDRVIIAQQDDGVRVLREIEKEP